MHRTFVHRFKNLPKSKKFISVASASCSCVFHYTCFLGRPYLLRIVSCIWIHEEYSLLLVKKCSSFTELCWPCFPNFCHLLFSELPTLCCPLTEWCRATIKNKEKEYTVQNTLFATSLGRLYFSSKTPHDFNNYPHFTCKIIGTKLECFILKLMFQCWQLSEV